MKGTSLYKAGRQDLALKHWMHALLMVRTHCNKTSRLHVAQCALQLAEARGVSRSDQVWAERCGGTRQNREGSEQPAHDEQRR